MKKLVPAIAIVVVLAAIAAGWSYQAGLWGHEKGDTLTLYGNVDIRTVDLGFRVAGRIAEMPVDEGDHVAPGDVLARLDPVPLEQALAAAKAEVDAAKAARDKAVVGNRPQEIAQAKAIVDQRRATVARAEPALRRAERLVKSDTISQSSLDSAEAEYREAEAMLEAARQSLALLEAGTRAEDIAAAEASLSAALASRDAAETALEDATLKAAQEGTVMTRAREPGAIVAAGATVFTVAIDRPVRVRAYVSEPDLGKVVPGQKVELTTDSTDKGLSWDGGVHLADGRVHAQVRADAEPSDRSRLSSAHHRVGSRRCAAAGPAGDGGPPRRRPVTDAATATLEGVTRRFAKGGAPALDNVSMAIRAGLMTGLVGPDGAGKTTLIRLLAGLLDPTAGRVTVLGKPATGGDRARIGYMPQRFGLYEDLSVIENLTLYADLRGLPRGQRGERFAELLRFTDLGPFQTRLAGRLSGGMKQKLGLACALVETPELLLLDEPGVGVDPVSRRELWAMVKKLTGEGIAVLWSTAYLDEAEKCDTVFLLSEGKLIHSGPPRALTEEVAGRTFRMPEAGAGKRQLLTALMDETDVRDATIQGASLRLLMAPEAVPPEGAVAVPPRFEDAFVDRLGGGPPGTSLLAENYRAVPDGGGAAIEAKGLTKRFGSFTAADDIDLDIPRGEIFGLLGPNGAGKSTTFKMLCGLLTPTSGEGRVAGHDLRHARAEARQSLGYMAQKFSLYGDLSVRQNLNFFAGVYGLTGAHRRATIERMIGIFHLEPYLRQNAGGCRSASSSACRSPAR